MTADRPSPRARLLGFGLLVVAVYAVFDRIVEAGLLDRAPGVVAGAITFDLTVTIPALFYLMVVRATSLPGVSVIPVALLGLFGASAVLPPEHRQAVALARQLAVPAELLLLGYVALRVRRAIRTEAAAPAGGRSDPLDRLRAVLRGIVPVPAAADAAAHEIAFLHYAFLSWRSRPDVGEGELAFSYHRRNGYAGMVAAAAMAALVELVAVHALVARWSEPLAWALTGLSAYGLVWLAGFFQAVRLRPILLTPDSLLVRIGLLWSVRVPYGSIARVERAGRPVPERGAKGYLHAVTLGPPRLLVELREPLAVEGLYGIAKRGVTRIGLAVDEPERFEAELRSRAGLAP